jgi:hypothetical protein
MTTATVPDAGCREIPLTRGLVALVDASDYEYVAQFRWWAKWSPRTQSFYASGRMRGHRRVFTMHRLVLNAPLDRFVDHINHDTLDNRRGNLRLVTNQQNVKNARPWRKGTSRYKGVSWDAGHKKWVAQIDWRDPDGKRRHARLGRFADERSAAAVYDSAARQHHGVFAWLNCDHFDLGEA